MALFATRASQPHSSHGVTHSPHTHSLSDTLPHKEGFFLGARNRHDGHILRFYALPLGGKKNFC